MSKSGQHFLATADQRAEDDAREVARLRDTLARVAGALGTFDLGSFGILEARRAITQARAIIAEEQP